MPLPEAQNIEHSVLNPVLESPQGIAETSAGTAEAARLARYTANSMPLRCSLPILREEIVSRWQDRSYAKYRR